MQREQAGKDKCQAWNYPADGVLLENADAQTEIQKLSYFGDRLRIISYPIDDYDNILVIYFNSYYSITLIIKWLWGLF